MSSLSSLLGVLWCHILHLNLQVPIKLYLYKQAEGWSWPLDYSLPVSDLDSNFRLFNKFLQKIDV